MRLLKGWWWVLTGMAETMYWPGLLACFTHPLLTANVGSICLRALELGTVTELVDGYRSLVARGEW